MKNRFWNALFSVFLFCGCRSDTADLNKNILAFCTDGKISQSEFDSLVAEIRRSENPQLQMFKNASGAIDDSKLVDYIIKYVKAVSGKTIALENIWTPENQAGVNYKFNINFFLENSASIDGYVTENSTFKTTIFKLLSDLKNLPSTNNLNLSYINTRPITVETRVTRDEIQDFYNRLNPTDFKSAGGDRGVTDIEKMLRQFLDSTNGQNLNVFVSDCVFSPGRSDAKKYLDGQYAAIYNDFMDARSKKPGLSLIVLQCTSKFDGTYYDYLDHPHPNILCERPYYIWFIGTSAQIKEIVDNKILEQLKDGYKNKLVIINTATPAQPAFKIMYRPVFGEFDSKLLQEGTIINATASKDNGNIRQFGFRVAVNFANSLQYPDYFSDSTNYRINDSHYSLQAVPISDHSDAETAGYTHILTLKTATVAEESLKIDVIAKIPDWVSYSTSNDDTGIDHSEPEQKKTFGFKYLAEGICDAFYPKSGSNALSSINIIIKK